MGFREFSGGNDGFTGCIEQEIPGSKWFTGGNHGFAGVILTSRIKWRQWWVRGGLLKEMMGLGVTGENVARLKAMMGSLGVYWRNVWVRGIISLV